MTGVALRYQFETGDIAKRLGAISSADRRRLFKDIGERVLAATLENFDHEQTPEGEKWEPSERAIEENGKTLQDRGRLRDSYTYQILPASDEVEIGSAMIYAAIHHFGGKIKKKERTGTVYFKQGKDGTVGNKFVKKKKSNFAQDVTIGAHEIEMPARPALGLTPSQHAEIGDMVIDFYGSILAGR